MKKLLILTAALAFAAPAQAATVGLSCPDGAHVMTGVDAAHLSVPAGCTVGFSVHGGYWAIAAAPDGTSGASGGYRSQSGADNSAIAACAAQGGDSCAVTSHGYDDGTMQMMMDHGMSDSMDMSHSDDMMMDDSGDMSMSDDHMDMSDDSMEMSGDHM
ncbi:MAG: hypothetical protein KDJ19_09850 [Hyphomicrobiaceae bacterium]|nr:hypothetical protein [Hyphomicrobiaceae bacterium]MCC0023209.1 hypothetical protein [Hyphomicrobiaceae bacterium]